MKKFFVTLIMQNSCLNVLDKRDFTIIKLEKHDTKDIHDNHVNGSLTVVWRDWDNAIELEPKMVYTTSVNPGERKGPHLHTKRDSFFVCTRGKVIFVIKNKDGKYTEIESSEEEPVLIGIPHGIASAHINVANEKSTILTMASLAWRPDDNEMKNVFFDDYDWEKWQIK